MLSKSFLLYAVIGTLYSTTLASPPPVARDNHNGASGIRTLADAANQYPQLLPLEHGNVKFRQDVANSGHPDLLQELTVNGQHPEFLYLGCR